MFKVLAVILSIGAGFAVGHLALPIWATLLLAATIGFLLGLIGVALDDALGD